MNIVASERKVEWYESRARAMRTVKRDGRNNATSFNEFLIIFMILLISSNYLQLLLPYRRCRKQSSLVLCVPAVLIVQESFECLL